MVNQLEQLHWFNFRDLPSKKETLDNVFLCFLKTLCGFANHPIYLKMQNGRESFLETYRHSQNEIIRLNKVGVHFFLYEPICSYLEGKTFNRSFYSELEHEVDLNLLRCVELDSIKQYIENNNLTKVTIHSGDYNIEKFLSYYSPYMTLLCDDLFLKNYSVFETTPGKIITKKFICANWRYTKHRHLLAAYVSSLESNYSWYYHATVQTLEQDLFFNLNSWKSKHPKYYNQIQKGTDLLNENSPVLLDMSDAEVTVIQDAFTHYYPNVNNNYKWENPARNNGTHNLLEKFYNESFCDIVTESRFAQHTANFSEKLFQSVKYLTPFILIAPPQTLKYAREFGFKTFGEFWDESYDECWNHEERLLKIFALIDSIDAMSLSELGDLYKAMTDTLSHNYFMLLEKSPFKTIQKHDQ